LTSAVRGIAAEARSSKIPEEEKLDDPVAKFFKQTQEAADRAVEERNRPLARQARTTLQSNLDVIRGSSAQGEARLRQQLAIQGIGVAARNRNLTPTQIAGLDLSQTQAANEAEYRQKYGTLGTEFLAQSQAATAAPLGSSLRQESAARAKELEIQLSTLESTRKRSRLNPSIN
jgi:hypothetical protein